MLLVQETLKRKVQYDAIWVPVLVQITPFQVKTIVASQTHQVESPLLAPKNLQPLPVAGRRQRNLRVQKGGWHPGRGLEDEAVEGGWSSTTKINKQPLDLIEMLLI